MKPELQTGFLDRIRTRLPDMHPAERKLGAFLLDFPGELASYDAQELARLAGVSKATVSRFVRRIGFESYDHARRSAREESLTGSRLFLAHAEEAQASRELEAALSEERENIAWTFERIDAAELEALVAAILKARKVWILGQRLSHSFATYLGWQLVKLVPDVAVIPRSGESLGEHMASMRREDLLIHVALRRRMASSGAILAEAVESGIPVALISDESLPPDPQAAWHFRCRIASASPQFNHAAVLSLCHWIVVRASVAAAAKGRGRLRRIDEINERIGDL